MSSITAGPPRPPPSVGPSPPVTPTPWAGRSPTTCSRRSPCAAPPPTRGPRWTAAATGCPATSPTSPRRPSWSANAAASVTRWPASRCWKDSADGTARRGRSAMKFTVDYPIVTVGYDPALVTAAGMTRVAQAAEEYGYDAISFSEHPAPSHKWLNAGGHESLHQTSALPFCAAVTSRGRLMTYLLGLAGRRRTVVAGTGYLRSEFLALNVDMSLRNELFDESLEVLRGVWSEVPFAYQGKHFTARGVASLPGPVQPGGPPVLIGGNSALARARAARNQGWSPL